MNTFIARTAICFILVMTIIIGCVSQSGSKKPTTNSLPDSTIPKGHLSTSEILGIWAMKTLEGEIVVYAFMENDEGSHAGLGEVFIPDFAWRLKNGDLYAGGMDEEMGTSTPLPKVGGTIKNDILTLSTRMVYASESDKELRRVRNSPPPALEKQTKEYLNALAKDVSKALER